MKFIFLAFIFNIYSYYFNNLFISFEKKTLIQITNNPVMFHDLDN